MNSYEFAQSGSCCSTNLCGNLNSSNIAAYHNSYQSGTDLLSTDQGVTSAAFTIWSEASIAATSPLVSTIPNASCVISYILLVRVKPIILLLF